MRKFATVLTTTALSVGAMASAAPAGEALMGSQGGWTPWGGGKLLRRK
jgi:Spy/CpxP family protein refolding chaperone